MRGRDSIWVAGAPPCAPSVHQTRKNWPDLEVIIVGRQSQIKREVTLRATLGDRNQRLNSGGKGIIKGTRFHKVSRISIRLFHQAASGRLASSWRVFHCVTRYRWLGRNVARRVCAILYQATPSCNRLLRAVTGYSLV